MIHGLCKPTLLSSSLNLLPVLAISHHHQILLPIFFFQYGCPLSSGNHPRETCEKIAGWHWPLPLLGALFLFAFQRERERERERRKEKEHRSERPEGRETPPKKRESRDCCSIFDTDEEEVPSGGSKRPGRNGPLRLT